MLKRKNEKNILPLLLDLTNPSPDLGFGLSERQSIQKRQKPDVILLLAVIHHLVISNNVPFKMVASWLANITDNLIIEFVPKEDSQVARYYQLVRIFFHNIIEKGFEDSFSEFFSILNKKRKINLMGLAVFYI